MDERPGLSPVDLASKLGKMRDKEVLVESADPIDMDSEYLAKCEDVENQFRGLADAPAPNSSSDKHKAAAAG